MAGLLLGDTQTAAIADDRIRRFHISRRLSHRQLACDRAVAEYLSGKTDPPAPPRVPHKGPTVGHKNASRRALSSYRDYYSEANAALVAARDHFFIDAFGYSF
jgi:hypothetical protein